MTTLTILRGLPGSGKSTWARKHVDSNTVIVSLDGLREMMAGGRQAWHETMNPQLNRILVRLEQVCEQLSREPRPWPHMEIDKADSLFDYKPDMFHLIDYDPWPSIKAPVAV